MLYPHGDRRKSGFDRRCLETDERIRRSTFKMKKKKTNGRYSCFFFSNSSAAFRFPRFSLLYIFTDIYIFFFIIRTAFVLYSSRDQGIFFILGFDLMNCMSDPDDGFFDHSLPATVFAILKTFILFAYICTKDIKYNKDHHRR